MDSLNKIILESVQGRLPQVDPKQKKSYISSTTWALLEQKWKAIEEGNHEEANHLERSIKNEVKKDREEDLLAKLEEINAQGYKWDGLKKMWAKFTPAFTKFKDSNGKHVAHKDYPKKAAEYLHDVQWKPPIVDASHHSRLHVPLQMALIMWINFLLQLRSLSLFCRS
jgi:hypothetical protein